MTPSRERDDLLDLIDGFIEGRIEINDAERLKQRLAKDDKARLTYIEYLDLYSEILKDVGHQRHACESLSAKSFSESLHRRSRVIALAATVSACSVVVLLFGLIFWNLMSSRDDLLTESANVTPQEEFIVIGDQVGRQTPVVTGQQIEVGPEIRKFHLHNGIRCTVQGPAQLRFLSQSVLVLNHGVFVAHVPENAIGFRVQTPHVNVVDLGTTFGVAIESDGHSEVHVFEGTVSTGAASSTSEEPRTLLKAGQTFRRTREGNSEVVHELQTDRFGSGLHQLYGIQQLAGEIQVLAVAPPSSRPGKLVSDSAILLIPEKEDVELMQDLKIIPPTLGVLSKAEECIESVLPSGTQCSSVLLHSQFQSRGAPLAGTIRFDQPILGLVISTEGLFESDPFFARSDMEYPQWSEVVEKKLSRGSLVGFMGGTDRGDVIHVHEDQRTLSVKLIAGNGNLDQIRVLLKSPDSPESN